MYVQADNTLLLFPQTGTEHIYISKPYTTNSQHEELEKVNKNQIPLAQFIYPENETLGSSYNV